MIPHPIARAAVLAALAVPWLAGCDGASAEREPAPAPAAAPEPLQPGAVFPPSVHRNLNPEPGGTLDLAELVGRRPVILYYWVAGNLRSEQVFAELEALVHDLGAGRAALVGLVVPRPNADAAAIGRRIASLGLSAPVLEDRDYVLGRQLQVARVPHIALLDAEGRLQLTSGASLRQEVEPGLTLEAVIRSAATTGRLATYGALGRYFPVKELEGLRCPDFRAPLLASSVEQHWSALMDERKVNVLVFWSVDCPHCRHALPELNAWLRENPAGLNVVSAAMVRNEAARVKTREFCDLNGFVFPTLVDDSRLTELFQVTATPTVVIIRPDGVIDSTLIADAGIGPELERKRQELLGS